MKVDKTLYVAVEWPEYQYYMHLEEAVYNAEEDVYFVPKDVYDNIDNNLIN